MPKSYLLTMAALRLNVRSWPDSADFGPTLPTGVFAASWRLSANLSVLFAHDLPAVRHYHVDIAALAASPTRLVFGYGKSAPDGAAYRATAALAAKLGEAPVEFPGGHIGWLLRPNGFAARLNEILGQA
jgi:hypothetical protein